MLSILRCIDCVDARRRFALAHIEFSLALRRANFLQPNLNSEPEFKRYDQGLARGIVDLRYAKHVLQPTKAIMQLSEIKRSNLVVCC